MKPLYLKLATPTVEVIITAKDSAASDKFVAGFVRNKFETAQEIVAEANKLAEANNEEGLQKLLKGQIKYLREVSFFDEEGKNEILTVSDTRQAEANSEVWGEEDKCLDFLLDTFFSWPSYTSALISAFYKANLNLDLGSDAERKNY